MGIQIKKVLILEDSRETLQCLKKVVKEIDREIIIFAATNTRDAYQYVMEHTIDVFIIDIILKPKLPGDASGLHFAERVRAFEKYMFTPMIVVTSLEDARYITYEKLHCYSFVEKPFKPHEISRTIAQCLKYSDLHLEEKTIFFRGDRVVISVPVHEVVYAEIDKRNLCVYLENEDVIKIPYITVGQFLKEANDRNLIQCSRGAFISVRHIRHIHIHDLTIELSNGKLLEIGSSYKKEIKEMAHVINGYLCD